MYDREHELASEHPVAKAGIRKADAAIKRMRKSLRTKADKLREKAAKLLHDASEMEYLASKYSEYETPFADLRTKIEDEAYWAARAIVGVLPRDENDEYIDGPEQAGREKIAVALEAEGKIYEPAKIRAGAYDKRPDVAAAIKEALS